MLLVNYSNCLKLSTRVSARNINRPTFINQFIEEYIDELGLISLVLPVVTLQIPSCLSALIVEYLRIS